MQPSTVESFVSTVQFRSSSEWQIRPVGGAVVRGLAFRGTSDPLSPFFHRFVPYEFTLQCLQGVTNRTTGGSRGKVGGNSM